jgi:hypothetical protein
MSDTTLLELFDSVIDGYEFMLEEKIGSRKEIEAELVSHKAMRELLMKSIEGLKKDLKAKLLQDMVDEWFGVSKYKHVVEE